MPLAARPHRSMPAGGRRCRPHTRRTCACCAARHPNWTFRSGRTSRSWTDLRQGDVSNLWTPSEHGEESGALQKRVARGLTWTLNDTWGSQLLALLIFAMLARLLNPADFGLVALAAVFVALGQLFADQGLGDAVIQRRVLTRLQLDTAFWAAMATGGLLTALGLLLAGPISQLVREPRLEPILQALSLIFVLVALSSIQMGLLRREMDFRALAIRKLVAIA